jgi:DNA-3-methyladenine glycosylase II
VFPANDTSIASNIALVAGSAPLDVQRVLDALGPQRGMLYFHLLLGRLEARGDIARPSFETPLAEQRPDTHSADSSDA